MVLATSLLPPGNSDCPQDGSRRITGRPGLRQRPCSTRRIHETPKIWMRRYRLLPLVPAAARALELDNLRPRIVEHDSATRQRSLHHARQLRPPNPAATVNAFVKSTSSVLLPYLSSCSGVSSNRPDASSGRRAYNSTISRPRARNCVFCTYSTRNTSICPSWRLTHVSAPSARG